MPSWVRPPLGSGDQSQAPHVKKDLTDSPGCGDGSGQMLEGLEVFCPERKRSENARAASRNLWTHPATEGPSSVKADLRRMGRSSMGARAGLIQKEFSMKNCPIMEIPSERRGPQTATSPPFLAPGL